MSRPAAPPIRSQALEDAIDDAVDGDPGPLLRFLQNNVNLRGQIPSADFCAAFGEAVAQRGAAADDLLNDLMSAEARDVGGDKAVQGLAVLVAHAMSARLAQRKKAKAEWIVLQQLAEDEGRPVREGVVNALTRLGARSDESAADLVAQFSAWTDGFLQAAVAVETLAQRAVLVRLHDEDAVRARLEEALQLAINASRSASRSQGRRRLLETLGDHLAAFMQRFPSFIAWLTEQAGASDPEVRAAFERTVERAEKVIPTAELDGMRAALDAALGPRRDPTTYRGPTRGRGRKAQRRNERR